LKLVEELTLLDTHPVRRYEWPNGFEAFLIHNPISPVAAYLTLYTVGSASEGERERGLAHFFEHMMFRETQKLGDGDFDRIMAELGGVGLNAYTSYDATAYHVNVPAANLERVIELEADRMVNLRLSPDLIEKERGAVLGEMKMYKDLPSEQMWETVMASAFAEHPYRHPIIGYMDQVAGFKDEDFAGFYGRHYAPNRAVVVVAGGFEEAPTLELLERAYGKLPAGAPRPADEPPEAALAESLRVEIGHDKITSENLTLVTRTPGLTSADTAALVLLGALLTGGQSSPLHRRIVLEGLGTHVSATLLEAEMMLTSPGLFIIEVALQHGVPAEAAEQALEGVLGDFVARGVPEEELERARNQVRLAYYASLRSNMSLARHVGGYAVACGDPLLGEKLFRALERATPAQVGEALERYVVSPPRVVVVQRPGERSDPS
jgi:zinc protease